jgi:hypothetical protein
VPGHATTLSALVVALTASADPAPKPSPTYYPTKVGAEAVCQAGKAEFTRVVTAAEVKGGAESRGVAVLLDRELAPQLHDVAWSISIDSAGGPPTCDVVRWERRPEGFLYAFRVRGKTQAVDGRRSVKLTV